jgi:hypothetical protein
MLLALFLACAREGVWTLGRDGNPEDSCAGEPPGVALAPVDALLTYTDTERWTLAPVDGSTWFCRDLELDSFRCSGPDAEQDYGDVGLQARIRWEASIEGSWQGDGLWQGRHTVTRSCEGEGCATIQAQGEEFCAFEEPIVGERRGPLPE